MRRRHDSQVYLPLKLPPVSKLLLLLLLREGREMPTPSMPVLAKDQVVRLDRSGLLISLDHNRPPVFGLIPMRNLALFAVEMSSSCGCGRGCGCGGV